MKIYTLIISIVLSFSTISSYADTYFGYTNGTSNRKDGYKLNSGEKQGLAIYLPASKMAILKGKTITGIRTVFGTTQASNISVFISKEIGGSPVFTQTISNPKTTFSNFKFDTPYTIDGEALYIGYTFDISADYNPLLFDKSSDTEAGLSWAYIEGVWTDVSQCGYGAANIQIIVSDAPTFCDLMVKPITFEGFIKAGSPIDFTGQIYNFGSEIITSFDLTCQVGKESMGTYSFTGLSLAPGKTYDLVIKDFISNTSGNLTLNFSASKINGVSGDADNTDNSSGKQTYIYPQETNKRILLETFTGQTCPNCPAGHATIQGVINGQEDHFIEVAHHSGYNPDFFTMKEDYSYTWFYNSGGSTYAPACMANRKATEGAITPVVQANMGSAVKSVIAAAELVEPYVTIDIDNQYDANNRKAILKVSVTTHVVPPTSNPKTLNVWITQDNMVSYQSSAGSAYVHNHVFRGSLTGTWGVALQLEQGKTISQTFEYLLPETIVSSYSGEYKWDTDPNNMHFVAFVGDISETDATDCVVFNSATIALNANTANLSMITNNAETIDTQYFDLTGKPINNKNLQSGIYVVRKQMSDGSYKINKVIIQ